MLQLMAGSPRARRSSQGQNGARMLASKNSTLQLK
jgi:hypothetical protein